MFAEYALPAAAFATLHGSCCETGRELRAERGIVYTRCFPLSSAVAASVRPSRSSVAQWQSIRLLTGGLLVRVQPEEPNSLTNSIASSVEPSFCDVNCDVTISEFSSDARFAESSADRSIGSLVAPRFLAVVKNQSASRRREPFTKPVDGSACPNDNAAPRRGW